MELARSLWLAMLIPAMSFSFYGEAAATDGQAATAGGPPPETNVLCVSKCGTCPTVCSSTSPPPPSDGSGYSSLSPPRSTSPPPSATAGQQQQPQAKGGEPSGYYYFFTAGSGPSCGASSFRYAPMLLALVLPLVAV